jgi:hypothetical protein
MRITDWAPIHENRENIRKARNRYHWRHTRRTREVCVKEHTHSK